jgi:hypothetical protein
LKVHLKALFETIINELPEECLQIKEHWDKFNLDELFALVICKDNDKIIRDLGISSILDKVLDEVPDEVIYVVKHLVTSNEYLNIDGIKKLMKVAHPYLKKKISTDSKNPIDLKKMTITIPNIKSKLKFPEETKEMYQNFKLHKEHDDKTIFLKKSEKLEEKYIFQIIPDGIIIGIPQLYELLLKVTYYDKTAMSDLLELFSPILRDIRGAQVLLDISRL